MFKEIISKLKCPQCTAGLTLTKAKYENEEIYEGTLVCENNHEWQIHDGVLNFNSSEQELGNNWSAMYEKYNYEELDKLIMDSVPEIQMKSYKAAFSHIEEHILKNNDSWIIDIATGRGMLLLELVKRFGNKINLVCVDLSHTVLKYDRLKCMNINPHIKVNYIACDATNLPLREKSIDKALSLFGIANMADVADQGIRESVRVSKNGLLNIGIVVRDDNPKIEDLNLQIKEAGYDLTLDTCKESNFFNLHKIGKEFRTESEVIFEGIAEKAPGDLIPIEGEWFGITAVRVR